MNNNFKKYDEYNDEIENENVKIDTDIKINPDYYIHHLLMKVQSAISDNDLNVGFTKYFLLVEQLETIAESSGLLDNVMEDSEKSYKEVMQEKEKALVEEHKKDSKDTVMRTKLANYKLKIITESLFSSRTIKGSLLVQ